MIITVVSGDRQVDIRIKGHGRKALARAEEAATRLLAACPPPQPAPPAPAFGYSLGAEVSPSYQDPGDHHGE